MSPIYVYIFNICTSTEDRPYHKQFRLVQNPSSLRPKPQMKTFKIVQCNIASTMKRNQCNVTTTNQKCEAYVLRECGLPLRKDQEVTPLMDSSCGVWVALLFTSVFHLFSTAQVNETFEKTLKTSFTFRLKHIYQVTTSPKRRQLAKRCNAVQYLLAGQLE